MCSSYFGKITQILSSRNLWTHLSSRNQGYLAVAWPCEHTSLPLLGLERDWHLWVLPSLFFDLRWDHLHSHWHSKSMMLGLIFGYSQRNPGLCKTWEKYFSVCGSELYFSTWPMNAAWFFSLYHLTTPIVTLEFYFYIIDMLGSLCLNHTEITF